MEVCRMDNIGVQTTLYNKSIKMIHWNHSERNYASIEMGRKTMKERFEIYDGSAEAKKAKGKSKNLSGFHPLFTASARRSIALDSLKIWLLPGFVVGVVTGVATGAGAVSVLLGLLIAAVIYFGFRDDVYKKVYGPEHDRGQLPLPEGMSWEEAVDRIRRGFANPDVEQVTDTADAMTFYSKKRGTYQLKNTADGLKMTILTKPSKSSKKEYLYAVFSSVLLSQVIAILYPEKISAEQVEEEKAAVRKLFGAHRMPLLIELAITAAFVAFAVYMLYPVLYSDNARSKGVSDGYLSTFPAGATVGEVLDDFFANGTWENYEQDGVTFVHYSGECVSTQTGEKATVGIYFKLNDDGSFEIDRMTMDGETMNLLMQNTALSEISNSYCNDHGIASSNALEGSLDELENALSDALADSSSSVSVAEPESETVSVAESTVYDEPEEYTQNQTESDSTGYEIHQNSLAEDIYISIGDYTSGNMTEEQKAEFRSYGENAFYSAWQDAMYSDVYRCWGRYGYLVAWEQFGDYLDFYEGIFGSERLKDYDSIYNNAPTGMETDDEAGYYVDEVLALAEKNNADMIFN